MMELGDCLFMTPAWSAAFLPGPDPFRDEYVLREAQVLDVRLNAVSGVVACLFELRQSLYFEDANTGVLVVQDSSRLEWEGFDRLGQLTAWSVSTMETEIRPRSVELTVHTFPAPGGRLSISAGSGFFLAGTVANLTDAPPDYTSHTAEGLIGRIAGWASPFEVATAAQIFPRGDSMR